MRKIWLLLFLFPFLSGIVFASTPPSASATIDYAQAGDVIINLYTEYHYPPEHLLITIDDTEIDDFLSTETYHTYTLNLSEGDHSLKVYWDGPMWYGLAYQQDILVRDDFYTKEEVESLIEEKLSNHYNKTEIDEITDSILSLFNNYYPKETIDQMVSSIEDNHYSKEEINNMINDICSRTRDIEDYIRSNEDSWKSDSTISIGTFVRWVKEKAEKIYNAIYNFIYRDFVPRTKYEEDISNLNERIDILEDSILEVDEDAYYNACVRIMRENNLTKIRCGKRTYVTLEDGSIVGIEPLW